MDFMRDFREVPVGLGAAAGFGGKVFGDSGGGGGSGQAKAKGSGESVIVRPTERTKRLRGGFQPSTISIGNESQVDLSSGSRLMALPLGVRQRIWRLVVVETRFFVYPAISTEQPDLAMTSRQVRGEVLPLYYGENTFAVEVSVEMERKVGSGRVSLGLVQKWMAALEKDGHVATIAKWALSLAIPAGDAADPGMPKQKNDREVLISIQYPTAEPEKHGQPEVEIHRQGFCLLPSHEEYRRCVRMCYPRWVDDALAAAFLAERHDRGKQVILFAACIERKGHELVESRCVHADELVGLEDD